jgi:hypothetical protein
MAGKPLWRRGFDAVDRRIAGLTLGVCAHVAVDR